MLNQSADGTIIWWTVKAKSSITSDILPLSEIPGNSRVKLLKHTSHPNTPEVSKVPLRHRCCCNCCRKETGGFAHRKSSTPVGRCVCWALEWFPSVEQCSETVWIHQWMWSLTYSVNSEIVNELWLDRHAVNGSAVGMNERAEEGFPHHHHLRSHVAK